MERALVVFSGGQDSTTCLGVALKECDYVEAITFDYNQKHIVELAAAERICNLLNVDLTMVDLRPILSNMRSSALITHGDTTQAHPLFEGLPASFVPARNALFLTAAYGIAIEHTCNVIYAGMCETDYSGYPDCRDAFIQAFNAALNLGYQSEIEIRTPLMFLNKAQTFRLAYHYNILDTVINESVTCYEGNIELRHDWGNGCGECPACKLRAKGWNEYRNAH